LQEARKLLNRNYIHCLKELLWKRKKNLKNQILQQRLEKLKQRLLKPGKIELEPEDKDHNFPYNKTDENDKIENKNKNNEPDTSDEEWTEEMTIDNEECSDEEEEEEEVTTQKKAKKGSSKFLDDEVRN